MADRETFQRAVEVVERVKGDDEAVRLKLSFASETPYERWFGLEVLGLGRGEYDFGRLKNGAPFLADHRNAMDSILGVVEDARVREGKAYATVRLADTPKAQEYLKLLDAGMGEKISVGYMVNKFEKGEKPDKEGRTTYRAVKWEPYEVSAVAVAADDGVGVGRSLITEADGLAQRSMEMPNETKTDQVAPEVIAKDAAGKERERIAEIVNYGKVHKDIGGVEAANDVISQGGTLEDLKDSLVKASQKQFEDRTKELAAKGDLPKPSDGDLDLSAKDAAGLDLSRFVRSKLEGKPELAKREHEVVEAWTKQMLDRGVKPARGISIPPVMIRQALKREMALSEMRSNLLQGKGAFARDNLITGDSDVTALIGTDHMGDAFIPYLWNMSAFLPFVTNMDGLVGNVDIPREQAVLEASWVAQDADANETHAQTDKVTLSPNQLAAHTRYGRTVFNQSDPSISGILLRQGARAMALGEDAAVVHGGGSNQPQGVLGFPNYTTRLGVPTHGQITDLRPGASAGPSTAPAVRATGQALTWNDIINFETALGQANYGTDGAMFFINSRTKGYMKRTVKVPGSGGATSGEFIWDTRNGGGPLNGYPARVSEQIPFNLKGDDGTETSTATNQTSPVIFCDPSQIVCAHWSGVDMVVDPYTEAKKGYVGITWYRDIDVDILQPQAFAVIRWGAQVG